MENENEDHPRQLAAHLGAVPLGSVVLRRNEHGSNRVHGVGRVAPVAEDAAMSARCIAAIEAQKAIFMSPEYATQQPLSSLKERLACDFCIEAIRRPSLQDSEV